MGGRSERLAIRVWAELCGFRRAAELASQSGGEKHAVDHGGRIQHRESDQLCQREQSGGAAVRICGVQQTATCTEDFGGAGSTTFNVRGIAPGFRNGGKVSSSTPLAFTSDFPKREIQLGCGSASSWWVDLKKVRG